MKGSRGALAFFCNEVMLYDGKNYSAAITRPIQIFGTLANFFDKLYLMVPVKLVDSHLETGPVQLLWDKIDIIQLPYYVGDALQSLSGPLGFPWLIIKAGRQIVRAIGRADVAGATVPSLLGSLASLLALLMKKPVFHFVRADKKAHLAEVHPKGFAHFFYQYASLGLEAYANWALGHGVPTFVVGVGLLKKYQLLVSYKSKLTMVSPVLLEHFQQYFQSRPESLRIKPQVQRPRILFVGRLSKEKRIDDLLQAVNILRRQYGLEPDVAIVGDGPERQYLEQLNECLGLKNVHFHGLIEYGPKLADYYHWADLFVLPSVVESLGAVLVEAMACGLPAVATNIDGIPTIVSHELNGLLVPANSPRDLAEAIARIVRTPDLWRRFSQNALKTAEKFKVESEMKKLVEIFRGACFRSVNIREGGIDLGKK